MFECLIREGSETFRFDRRNRRPPRDPVNALLSFLYALLTSDCTAALEGVGLDPQVGYLHAVRPGRPALALDLLEELRAPVADRIALTLINRKQVTPQDFTSSLGGAVSLSDSGRRKVVVAYQKRKAEEVRHLLLDRTIPVGACGSRAGTASGSPPPWRSGAIRRVHNTVMENYVGIGDIRHQH